MRLTLATLWQPLRNTPLTRIQNEMDVGSRLLRKWVATCPTRRGVGVEGDRLPQICCFVGVQCPTVLLRGVPWRTKRIWACCSYQKHELTPRNRALLEKLIVTQLVKQFASSYGTRSFIIVFTRARHLSES
jgi:hypothetical protein